MKHTHLLLSCIIVFLTINTGWSQSPREIVRKANDLLRGESSISEGSLMVVKPTWSRQISTKMWMLEPDYALILITAPAKENGTVTLKRKNELWNWIPTIRRVIKIPPSMMLQPWMGSDFSNDDLVRQSSIVDDYEHTLIGEEEIEGYNCFKIELIPKPEAGVVWGKIIMWVSKQGYFEIKTDFYDEDGTLIKTLIGSEIKKMGGRTLPTHWEMTVVNKPGHKTVLDYSSIKFNVSLEPSFFSIQNMKRVR
ncbi:MAG TPA: outer membrane lipoprotein-sorting protein [Candidatus Marinimicrobia bacterium]|nr:outer membrane lipoprotein-sorting protein [Candidatus Neomarinimicrobiota bacterium]